MIAVVGAGLTGLALGRALLERHQDFIILEAEAVPGGVIRTARAGGDLLELGPQRTRLTEPMARLAASIGIANRLITAPPDLPLFILFGGRLRRAPLSPADLVTTDLLPLRAKLRALIEPLAKPPGHDESAAAYLARRFGRTTYERLLEPLFGGLYASDPADMLARHALAGVMGDLGVRRAALPRLLRAGVSDGRGRRAAVPACSFDGGLATLIDALHRTVADRTKLGAPVARIQRARHGFTLETPRGMFGAHTVVLTCDARAAARMIEPIATDAASRLRRLRYNRLALVHMRSDARIRAAGFQVAFSEPIRTRGVTFNDALFGRAGLYTAFLGGARDPGAVEQADAVLGATAAAEFEAVVGAGAEPIHVSRTWIPAWDRSWAALEGLELPAGIHLCANYESRVGIPGRLAAAQRLAASLSTRGMAAEI